MLFQNFIDFYNMLFKQKNCSSLRNTISYFDIILFVRILIVLRLSNHYEFSLSKVTNSNYFNYGFI